MPHAEVVVLETADPVELDLARNLLQEEGIPSRVESSAAASSLLSVTMGAHFGGVHQLLVPGELEERALLVLERAWPDPPQEADAQRE